MPMNPRPLTYKCAACGWAKTVAPGSDSLKPGEWFDRCPRCGSKELGMRAAGWLKGAFAELLARRRF